MKNTCIFNESAHDDIVVAVRETIERFELWDLNDSEIDIEDDQDSDSDDSNNSDDEEDEDNRYRKKYHIHLPSSDEES